MSADDPPQIYSLPLFPLHFVLFPHFPLQLHIFEERYKAMISACIERNEPFGVVLIQQGEEVGSPAVPHEVGCAARILAVKRFEDGRMNLLAAGERRFRLLDYRQADLPYLIGKVETVQDVPASAEEQRALTPTAQELFLRYLSLLAERIEEPLPRIELMDDPTLLTFYIASICNLPTPDKQRLLEMTDPCRRLEAEIRWLHAEVEELEAGRVREATLEKPQEQVEMRLVARPLDVEKERALRNRDAGRN